jgi:putative tricarboxylic transport membrane protein
LEESPETTHKLRESAVHKFIAGILFAVIGSIASAVCVAAESAWKPTRPVALIVGAAPGGSIDVTARLIQRVLDESRVVQSPLIVINKPGAGNGIAWSYLNDRGADGHSIAMGTTNLVTNEIIGAHTLNYRDVTTLAVLFDEYVGMVVRADSPLKSWKDAAEKLRRDPGALSIAFGPSLGSGSHTGAAVAVKSTGAKVSGARFVVYKSVSEALAALLGGQVDIVCGSISNMPPHLQAGRMRVLGVTSPKRLGGALAQAPTFREQGFDAVFTNWRSVIGPKNMRPEHVAYWEGALARVVQSPEWQRDLERNFWTPNLITGADAFKFMERSSQQFRTLWAEIGTKNQ